MGRAQGPQDLRSSLKAATGGKAHDQGITERVSSRIFRVVALPAPTDREKSQMYAQRYIPHLPAAGEI